MTIKITHLSKVSRSTRFSGRFPDVPYVIINLTFTVKDGDEGDYWEGIWKHESENYKQVVDIGNPVEYEKRVLDDWDVWIKKIETDPPLKQVWTYHDGLVQHLEKFNTFWFREWLADCQVTRAIFSDLQCFQKFGDFPETYRTTPEQIFYQHVKTLSTYWD